MRIVIALGGKALVEPGSVVDPLQHSDRVDAAASAVAELVKEHEVVITHGYGPRIGLVAMLAQTEHAQQRFPIDMISAENEGVIGHQLEVALRNACPGRRLASLLIQVEVAADDPAFAHHTKPIGPAFPAGDPSVRDVARERGWHLRIEGEQARRVVPAPQPKRVFDVDVINRLMRDGVTVTCAAGGGVPLAAGADGRLQGVEAVVEKEMTSALLAAGLRADLFLLISDVAHVERDWGSPNARPIHSLVASDANPQDFIEGSMRPKVAAACNFVNETHARAVIGSLSDAIGMVRGTSGTQVVPSWRGAHEESLGGARDDRGAVA